MYKADADLQAMHAQHAYMPIWAGWLFFLVLSACLTRKRWFALAGASRFRFQS